MTIQPTRLRTLKDGEPRAGAAYVLYWMQASQRSEANSALETAIAEANRLGLPVLVGFGLTDGYPEANARHYAFMLEGLADVAKALAARGIGFVIRKGSPDEVALALSKQAATVVCDRGYLRIQKRWRRNLAETATCPVIEVEGDVVVPVEAASGKHEFAARTLRPKIHRLWEEYLVPMPKTSLKQKGAVHSAKSDIDLDDIDATLRGLKVDHAVKPVRRFTGGEREAARRLHLFIGERLPIYAEGRNRPEAQAVSELSPYLHFGQISPLAIALAVRAAGDATRDNRAAFLEELIVRRELAINHVHYEENYDSFACLPDWARKALQARESNKRPHLYTRAQLEAGETHDRFWNAAQMEMRETGYMHNRLRMYWGKKVLEWSRTPEEAFDTLLAINNRYLLDGRDPSSFANVGWIFGLHDRPWFARPIFGTVRYMGDATLKKFDAEAYVAEVERLAREEEDGPPARAGITAT